MTFKIHPKNKKIFEFKGTPLILICATEHYGSVINRPFRFEKYLFDAYEKSQTLTRLFCIIREFSFLIKIKISRNNITNNRIERIQNLKLSTGSMVVLV